MKGAMRTMRVAHHEPLNERNLTSLRKRFEDDASGKYALVVDDKDSKVYQLAILDSGEVVSFFVGYGLVERRYHAVLGKPCVFGEKLSWTAAEWEAGPDDGLLLRSLPVAS